MMTDSTSVYEKIFRRVVHYSSEFNDDDSASFSATLAPTTLRHFKNNKFAWLLSIDEIVEEIFFPNPSDSSIFKYVFKTVCTLPERHSSINELKLGSNVSKKFISLDKTGELRLISYQSNESQCKLSNQINFDSPIMLGYKKMINEQQKLSHDQSSSASNTTEVGIDEPLQAPRKESSPKTYFSLLNGLLVAVYFVINLFKKVINVLKCLNRSFRSSSMSLN